MYTCKIYKLRCNCDCGQIYIGSTRNALRVRWGQHKQHSQVPAKANIKLYHHMNEVGAASFDYVLVEEFECRDKDHQRQVEDLHIVQNDTITNGLNGCRAFVTEKEKKERWKQYSKQYYETNQGMVKQRNRQYSRQYYETNKEHKKQYAKKRVTCECGAQINRVYLTRHRNTYKHIYDFIIHA